jgi:hypothetical protein
LDAAALQNKTLRRAFGRLLGCVVDTDFLCRLAVYNPFQALALWARSYVWGLIAMMKSLSLVLLVIALVCSMHSDPAQAQRVFVSATGSDGNPCTFVSPCRTFQHAHDIVPSGGEIDVLDPAGYGALTINKAISIQGHGFSGISAPSGTAITINAGSSDKINLRGLLIDGVGTGNNGISLVTGSALEIQDTLIRNFLGYGIHIGALNPLALLVSNTHISDISSNTNPNGSVYIGGTVTGAFDHVEVENGLHDGIILDGQSSFAVNLTISNSIVAKHVGEGIICHSVNSTPSVLLVQSSTIAHNAGSGLNAFGTGAVLRVTKSAITDNGTGFAFSSGGILESFGDNALRGNTADGAATVTVPLQ